MIRVLVWNEYYHEKKKEHIAEIYPNGIHGAIAEFLGSYFNLGVINLQIVMDKQQEFNYILTQTFLSPLTFIFRFFGNNIKANKAKADKTEDKSI